MLVAICSQCVSQDPFPAGSSGIQSKLHTPTTVQISSLEAVSHLNPDYKRLEKLVLNNNSLVSLAGLETSWVHRTGPSLLDLRNNHIREVSPLSKYLEGKHRLLNSNYLERLDKCFQAK